MENNRLSNLLDTVLAEEGEKDGLKYTDIVTFAESAWGLNLLLRPLERLVLKALYSLPFDDKIQNIELRNYPDEKVYAVLTEVEMLNKLFEDKRTNIDPQNEKITKTIKTTLCLVAGRRSFKTFLASIISAYEAYRLIVLINPQKYFELPESEEIRISNVANSEEQANVLFRALKARMDGSPFFGPYFESSLDTIIKLYTPYDLEKMKDGKNGKKKKKGLPSIKMTSLACSARSARGPGIIVLVTDEFAHFKDGSNQQSDMEIYKALSPTTATFSSKSGIQEGKVIAISSPLGEQGIMYNLAEQALNGSEDICYFRFPSWEANPKLTMNYLKSQETAMGTRDFLNEYGAEWLGGSAAYIDIPDKLRETVDKGGSIQPNLNYKDKGVRGLAYYIGIDPGISNDGFAVAIVHSENKSIILDKVSVFYAGETPFENYDILPVSQMVDYIANLFKAFNIRKGIIDQWESYSFLELLAQRGINNVERETFDRGLNSRIYKNFREKIYYGQFRMPPDDNLVRDILRLRQLKYAKNEIKVEAPAGSHDDIADAIVRAAWICTEETIVSSNPITLGVHGQNRAAMSVFANGPGNSSTSRADKKFLRQANLARIKGRHLYNR